MSNQGRSAPFPQVKDRMAAAVLAIFSAIKTLNSRLQALKAPIDGDFWEFVARARKSSPSETQTWLRERYELGREQEEIWQEHTFRFVLEPGIGRLVTAETMTEGGRKLIELHRMSHDVREYRDVCLAFDPQVKVPKRGLRVDLSTPRHVQIGWVES